MFWDYIDLLKVQLKLNNKKSELYKDFNNDDLQLILSSLHYKLISLLRLMNKKLPTENFYNYYPAKASREFIFVISSIENLKTGLKNTPYAFKVEEYNFKVIQNCKKILKAKGGSTIQRYSEKIKIYENKPIFILESYYDFYTLSK